MSLDGMSAEPPMGRLVRFELESPYDAVAVEIGRENVSHERGEGDSAPVRDCPKRHILADGKEARDVYTVTVSGPVGNFRLDTPKNRRCAPKGFADSWRDSRFFFSAVASVSKPCFYIMARPKRRKQVVSRERVIIAIIVGVLAALGERAARRYFNDVPELPKREIILESAPS